jgi:hypothetical protein
MIRPKCDKCGNELQAYGGLAFSPPETMPDDSPSRQVDKIHICVKCWRDFMAWLNNEKLRPCDKIILEQGGEIENLKKANSILRSALYDTLEMAEKGLKDSALDEKGNL